MVAETVWASASKCSETIKTAWYNDVYGTNRRTVEMETDGEHIIIGSSGLMPLLK